MSNNDKLVPTGKLSPLKVGLAAKLHQAKEQGNLSTNLLDCSNYPNRIVLCIDDSGSMATHMTKDDHTKQDLSGNDESQTRMAMCRKACEEFLNVCNPADTALGLYTISTGREFSLSVNYVYLLSQIRDLKDSGGTPTLKILEKIQEKEKVTRVVIVSDGESGALVYDYEGDEPCRRLSVTATNVLDKYKSRSILIDTVFIGDSGSTGETEMRLIAEYTGGLFLVFKSGESFKTKFKYLAPAYRGMLTSGQVKI